MDLKSLVDNCGDESRVSNPILGFVDLLSKDKYQTRDQYSSNRPYKPNFQREQHHNDIPAFSAKEFDEYNASLLHEFDKTNIRFKPNNHIDHKHRIREYVFNNKEEPIINRIIHHHPYNNNKDISKPMMNEWASEFNELRTNETFNHVYNQKKKMNHSWTREYIERASYDRFDEIYQNKVFLNKNMDEITEEFEKFNIKEKEDAENNDSIYDDDEIKELASKFNAYKDPRFRQSEFFQLMEKISQRKTEKNKNSEWSDEFIMNNNNNNNNIDEWKDDFIKSNYDLNNEKDWVDEYEEDEKFWTSGFNKEEFDDYQKKEEYEKVDFDKEDEYHYENDTSQYDDIWDGYEEYNDFMEDDLDHMIEKPIPYPFSRENRYMNEDKKDLFGIGLELYKKGDLTGAIEAFEACIKSNYNDDDKKIIADAFYYLGISQAENDRDDLAIIALINSLKNNPNNKDALLSLSVSYANEMYYHKVFECLMKWMSLSEEYSWILKDCDDLINDIDNDHETVTDAFIKAARMRPNEPDPDVQIALGLLYNVVKDYERSIDCFKSALLKRPDDYQLWNKLGATQANHGRYEDAIESYFHALNQRPMYTRTRFNLGVSFVKLNEYTEAAKSVLGALSINPDAIHIWDFLSMIFKKMGREDLREKSLKRDVNLFVDDFNF